jgi:hypothetical protein
MEQLTRQEAMRKPMSESINPRAAAERDAIERWEDEGGRPLALNESVSVRPGDGLVRTQRTGSR